MATGQEQPLGRTRNIFSRFKSVTGQFRIFDTDLGDLFEVEH